MDVTLICLCVKVNFDFLTDTVLFIPWLDFET